MKKIYTLFLVLILFSASSCKDFLDTQPEDFLSPEYYYTNETQINTALAGIYSIMADTRNEEPFYAASYISSMGTEGDDGYYRKGPDRNIVGQFLYNASVPAISHLWESLYSGINLANLMLERIDGADMPAAKREVARGEAHFLRAYYYFILVSNWGDVPLKLTSTTSPLNNEIARSPAREVYAQIVKDMETAYGLVPTATTVGFGGRVNKSAVAGILARVYLYWAGAPLNDASKYQNARDWALKVIDSQEHSLNSSYQQVFINYAADKYDIRESIWEVEFYGNRTDRPRQAGLVGNYIGIRSTSDEVGNSNANVRATSRLYQLYGNGDLRRDWAIAPFQYTPVNSSTKVNYASTAIWNRDVGKYRREYEVFLPKSKGYTPINFPILRYADVLLMYAEAENQVSGPTAAAINAVNMVRRRGYGKPVTAADAAADLRPGQYADKAAFLQVIQDERSRELCFECLRKYDLIRWGTYVFAMKAVGATYQNSSGVPSDARNVVPSLQLIDQKHLFWPIPTHELSLNRKLSQNPGW
ncbi:RagB/SusD family nutrient uptake outer membrane protein [Pedobacter yulinensis]|uniref:RagB/SusD family nutrient uptake outer membrane protein n=1 Tax=Pedobacter yulinensis TaxID=2126353 RepID=A0A2T3HML9_9SPHI|nr:RagB/SusD family nutrient uptake outer membrane protein [Pedobacter yulinensis]PST83698.1 RagB/SusD family nutrient uptake outer membrane protein [Pedobacter yulinensis]